MPTFDEHQAADFALTLTEHGQLRTVDGEELLCLKTGVELSSSEFERLLVQRCRLIYLAGSTADRVVGQLVEVDGERWQVVSVSAAGASVTWLLDRGIA